MNPFPFPPGTEVHLYARPHYNQRGRVTGVDARGRLTIQLHSGTTVQASACDCEAVNP